MSDEEKTTEQERDEYLAGWKRALADYDNLKKDLASEKEHARDIIRESVALSLLPVLDSFDQVQVADVLNRGRQSAAGRDSRSAR
jgi:molecular chaperone GrpE (heat shock protein)